MINQISRWEIALVLFLAVLCLITAFSGFSNSDISCLSLTIALLVLLTDLVGKRHLSH